MLTASRSLWVWSPVVLDIVTPMKSDLNTKPICQKVVVERFISNRRKEIDQGKER